MVINFSVLLNYFYMTFVKLLSTDLKEMKRKEKKGREKVNVYLRLHFPLTYIQNLFTSRWKLNMFRWAFSVILLDFWELNNSNCTTLVQAVCKDEFPNANYILGTGCFFPSCCFSLWSEMMALVTDALGRFIAMPEKLAFKLCNGSKTAIVP